MHRISPTPPMRGFTPAGLVPVGAFFRGEGGVGHATTMDDGSAFRIAPMGYSDGIGETSRLATKETA
jgi:hypothetical protein